jgi:chromosome segregation ATPase
MTELLAERKEEINSAKKSIENLDKQNTALKTSLTQLKADHWNAKQRLEEVEASKAEHEKIAMQSMAEKNKIEASNNKLMAWNAELDSEKIQLETKVKNLEQLNVELQQKISHQDQNEGLLKAKLKFFEQHKSNLEQLVPGPHNDIIETSINLGSMDISGDTARLKEQCALLEELNDSYEQDIQEFKEKIELSERRFNQLHEHFLVYKDFINHDANNPSARRIESQIEAQLKVVGLHKDGPVSRYVSTDYLQMIKQGKLSENIRRSSVRSHRDCKPIEWDN